jgi:arylsulfatase A-like enzyme
VVFTTDHGIALGEHNRTGKSNIHPRDKRAWLMFEELAHIPLIIRLPGMRPRKIGKYVQPVDLTATLLDLAGAEPDPHAHGRSLMDLVRGRTDRWRRECAISSAYLGRLRPKASGLPMLYAGGWAYGPRDEKMSTRGVLFDMARDGGQERNLVAANAQVASRMKARMRALLEELGTPADQVAALMGDR